jgi:hydrogenase expression/formation protein HypD
MRQVDGARVLFPQTYRDAAEVRALARVICTRASRRYRVMEVCGGQTHNLLRFGIDRLLAEKVEFIHGPGCPVCVTDASLIDLAIAIARQSDVILCTFGDMVRVPGSRESLQAARADGGRVQVVFGPLDAVNVAVANPDRRVVFFAVGFETTAPSHALAAIRARRLGLKNFFILSALVLVPPALEHILKGGDTVIDAVLAAGHVCTVSGVDAYHRISSEYHVPVVVTGFEPLDLLAGVFGCVKQLEQDRGYVENAYARVARNGGNPAAQAWVEEVFSVCDRTWRGIGTIANSGLALSSEYIVLDANEQFASLAENRPGDAKSECRAGDVLTGRIRPPECPCYGDNCTPAHPLGAPMVSAEGACAGYAHYHSGERHRAD